MAFPDVTDYAALFAAHDAPQGMAMLNIPDLRFAQLFAALCPLLVEESPFNAAMPQPFRWTAKRWLDGDAGTRAHLAQPENLNFLLSDLADYVALRRRG